MLKYVTTYQKFSWELYTMHSLTHISYMSVKYGDKKKLMFRKLLQLQKKVMRIVNFKTNDHLADAFYL